MKMDKTRMNSRVLDWNWSYEWEQIISKVFKEIREKIRCKKKCLCVP